MTDKLVGKSVPRKEGPDKVTGRARYIDDLRMPNMLYGVTVRSPVSRGRLRDVTYGPGIPWDEIIVVSAADIPAERNHVALLTNDQPFLADKEVRHAEEPILLLAHADKHLLERARKAAAGKDVRLGGGAATIRQYLEAGLVDELHLAIAPALLGRGEHLFAGLDLTRLGYSCSRYIASEKAAHMFLTRET